MSCKFGTASLDGKNIVITGGLGFIGSNLALACSECGGNVTIVDNMDPQAGGNTYNIHSHEAEINIVSGDICDTLLMQDVVLNADLIINSAALSSHSLSLKEPTRNADVNSIAVLKMLELIKTVNSHARFIQIGTTTQIGKSLSIPVEETHPEFPLDPYSAHKTLAEKYAYIYSQVHGLKTNSVRLPNIYGPRAAIHSALLTFNNYFIGLALQNKEITIFGDGRQYRNLLYVDDAVDAILKVAQNGNGSGDVFFAVHDDHHSVVEVAEQIISVFRRGSVRLVPWPDGRKNIDVGDAIYSNKKIKKEIGWMPTTSFRDGLIKTHDYYSGCLEKYL